MIASQVTLYGGRGKAISVTGTSSSSIYSTTYSPIKKYGTVLSIVLPHRGVLGLHPLLLLSSEAHPCIGVINKLLRGTIVNRTYGIHKNLYV